MYLMSAQQRRDRNLVKERVQNVKTGTLLKKKNYLLVLIIIKVCIYNKLKIQFYSNWFPFNSET